jgi:hypothetical protein
MSRIFNPVHFDEACGDDNDDTDESLSAFDKYCHTNERHNPLVKSKGRVGGVVFIRLPTLAVQQDNKSAVVEGTASVSQ